MLLALIVVTKVASRGSSRGPSGLPGRPGQLAVGLGQVGEFSFVLGSAAIAAGAIGDDLYVALVAAVGDQHRRQRRGGPLRQGAPRHIRIAATGAGRIVPARVTATSLQAALTADERFDNPP